jgi:RimJ/RimL family protein N-acetyltransferase
MFTYQGIELRKLSREDLPRLLELKSESWPGTHRVAILNPSDQEAWFASLDQENLVLVGSTAEQGSIGIYKVLRIDWQNRTAQVGWDVFQEFRGQGLGKRLVAAGTAFCFELLNLRRLDTEILETNRASRRCAEAVGFVLEGCRRQAVYRQRQALNSFCLGVLAEEFFASTPQCCDLLEVVPMEKSSPTGVSVGPAEGHAAADGDALVILILLLYHERPELVRKALASVARAGVAHPHWELAFIDDRSSTPGEPIAREILFEQLSRVRFYHNPWVDGEAESQVGRTMNQAIMDSGAQVAIMLCDDDELHPDYLANLSEFFLTHPEAASCYSLVHLYNPAWEDSCFVDNLTGPLNQWREPLAPANRLDASQVAWRTSVNRQLGAWFEFPKTACLDRDFFARLTDVAGPTPFSGFVAQYKGVHSQQLINHVDDPRRPHDAPDIQRVTPLVDVLLLMEGYAAKGKAVAVTSIYEVARQVYPEMEPVLRQRLLPIEAPV